LNTRLAFEIIYIHVAGLLQSFTNARNLLCWEAHMVHRCKRRSRSGRSGQLANVHAA